MTRSITACIVGAALVLAGCGSSTSDRAISGAEDNTLTNIWKKFEEDVRRAVDEIGNEDDKPDD